MNLKIFERLITFFIIITLPFTSIPERFSIPGLGNNLNNYFLLIAAFIIFIKIWCNKFDDYKNIVVYVFLFIIWQIICLIHGLIIFDFNNLPKLENITKIKYLIQLLESCNIYIQEKSLITLYLFLKFSRDILFYNNIIFISAVYIYFIYKEDFNKAFCDVRKAVLILVLIMGVYSIIEVLWLKFQLQDMERILVNLNVFLYDPCKYNSWHPPLLWYNQLRSLTVEPSFFGIISIFSLPFLWTYVYEKKNNVLMLLIFYFTFMIIATNSRTAIILLLFELLLLLIFTILRPKLFLYKNFLTILFISIMAFIFNLAITNNSNFNNYLENNIVSVTKVESRSNEARLANLIANIKVIAQYPILGIGSGLKDPYIDKNLPEFSYDNYEVRNWSRYMNQKGFLDSPYPAPNKFVDIAVSNGIIGLLIFLFPFLYVYYKMFFQKEILLKSVKLMLLIIIISSLLLAMLSASMFMVCDGIILGLLYLKIKEKNNTKNENL